MLGWNARRMEKDVTHALASSLHAARFAAPLAPLGVPLALIGGWLVWPAVDEDWKKETFSLPSLTGGAGKSDDDGPASAGGEPTAVVSGGSWTKEGPGAMPVLADGEAATVVKSTATGAQWTKQVGQAPTLAGGDDDDDDDDE
eukprot:g2291.t1